MELSTGRGSALEGVGEVTERERCVSGPPLCRKGCCGVIIVYEHCNPSCGVLVHGGNDDDEAIVGFHRLGGR